MDLPAGRCDGRLAAAPIAIYGKTVTNYYNGIGLLRQNRGSGALGAYVVQNVNVHDNIVTMSRAAPGWWRTTATAASGPQQHFAHDAYRGPDRNGEWFS